jgi:hypothetical protein
MQAPAQTRASRQDTREARHCASVVNGRTDLLPLLPVCELAQSLRDTLPNFVCEQRVTRSHRSPAGYLVGKEVIRATVTYEGGRERYSEITLNGRPTDEDISTVTGGPNTFGEFGSFLAGVLSPASKAEFTARAAEDGGTETRRVFDFRIRKENNQWWVVRDSRREVYPGIEGSLSLDGASRLMELRLAAANLPAGFPVASAELTVTYGDVTIEKLGAFRLPLSAEWTSCLRPVPWRRQANSPNEAPPCFRNEIVFENHRKFAARARIVPDANQR